jgi:cullin 1
MILYQKYTDSIKDYLTSSVLPDLQSNLESSDYSVQQEEAFLRKLQHKWANHELLVRWMQRFFQYLDRFCVEINSLTPLTDQGFKIFKGYVFQPLLTQITGAVLGAVQRERMEELVDVDLLKKTVDIFIYLSGDKLATESNLNPRKNLEEQVIKKTRDFYQLQSQALLTTSSLSEYLHKANHFYKEELSRTDRYLCWDEIKQGILKEFKNEMLLKHT